MFGFARITPWVGRLVAINAAVLLLLQTVLTAPAVTAALAFDPATPLSRPWTYLTYAFVHQDLLHLLFNMLGLYVFGTAVESRMGSRAFLAFWFYCAAGAALVTAVLNPLLTIPPFVGASGAVLGVAVAFALAWPDAELFVFPIPVPIKARTLAILVVAYNGVMALFSRGGGVAYEAHLGGALMGWLYMRVQGASVRRSPVETVPGDVERTYASQPASPRSITAGASSGSASAPRPRPRRAEPDAEAAEIDRVLDKISATGIASLTADERKFLDEVSSRRKKGDQAH